MKKAVFSMLVLILLFLGGCQKKHQLQNPRLVTQVDISCHKEDVQILRHYTDEKKIESVLLYVRLAEDGRPAAAAGDRATGEIYKITVTRADGEITQYRQKDHRYFSRDRQSWHEIDPEQAEGLYRLIRYLPSDSM